MRPLHPERDAARIEGNRAIARETFPGLYQVVKDLHGAGLIDGWRNVAYVGAALPEPRGAVAMTHIVLESQNRALAERMKHRGKT